MYLSLSTSFFISTYISFYFSSFVLVFLSLFLSFLSLFLFFIFSTIFYYIFSPFLHSFCYFFKVDLVHTVYRKYTYAINESKRQREGEESLEILSSSLGLPRKSFKRTLSPFLSYQHVACVGVVGDAKKIALTFLWVGLASTVLGRPL
jgi:hypothetical protein